MGPQALVLPEFEHFVRDARLVRDAYLAHLKLRQELGR